MPAKSWPADHADRCPNNDRPAGLNHDRASVEVATAIRAAMCTTAATFRSLSAEACEAQQGGEYRNRKNFFAHLPGSLCFAAKTASNRYDRVQCACFPMNRA
jgi:hypothetical protein